MKSTDWRKYDDSPLIDEDGTFLMDFYFIAVVDTNSGLWIAYCTINNGGDLMQYVDTDLWEPAPWGVEDISWWAPFELPDLDK